MHLVFGTILALLVPAVAIVYANIKIVCVIFRTHHQMSLQVNLISGYNGNTHSLTLKAIRSGRNVLLICLAFLIITLPICFYFTALILDFETNVFVCIYINLGLCL